MGNIAVEKSMEFAVRIVRLYRHLSDEKKEYVLSKQLLRSGTSIGTNLREATLAQTKKEFISKTQIALKEAGETQYWLELMYRTELLSEKEYGSIISDSNELLGLLTSTLKTAKANLQ